MSIYRLSRRFACGLSLALLAACATHVDLTAQPPRFSPASFADLPGWQNDDLNGFGNAATKTCARLAGANDTTTLRPGGVVSDWRAFCTAVTNPNANMRTVVETYLSPWRVTVRSSDDGLFTGYYEAALRGSRTAHDAYQTPIRARPLDHVIVKLKDFHLNTAETRLTGQLNGMPGDYSLTPYPDRKGIDNGAVPAISDRILAWVDDPVDAFFLEIQGSGRIAMDDGSVMHVGYAERNGQPYTPVGKILVERGEMTIDDASMQSIRTWMTTHPDQARALMQENKSYIFFRDIGADGPIGAENIALTPLRSMAIDKDMWSYGMPFYIDTAAPNGDRGAPRIQRLVLGQDTGGAIKGAVRGDLFWGFGDDAAHNAGIMKSRGNIWVLLPRGVTPRSINE